MKTVQLPSNRPPPVPDHLSPATAAWYREVIAAYELEPHHEHLLRLACEALDRCEQARRLLAEHGLTYQDGDGMPKTRPEVAIERDSRLAYARLLRELDLDLGGPVNNELRPPVLRSNGRRT
jgi:phage terminase small subunit